jgi:hypothetical protein
MLSRESGAVDSGAEAVALREVGMPQASRRDPSER